MKKYIALLLACVFYLSILPVTDAAFFNYNVKKLVFDNTYTSELQGSDLIAKGPWIDVRAHGAVANDNTKAAANVTAIQAAFDNCVDGQQVIFPAGVYYISSGLTFKGKRGARISGTGAHTDSFGTIIVWSGDGDTGATMLDVAGSKQIVIENIHFMGTSKYGVSGGYTEDAATLKTASAYKTGIGLFINKGSYSYSTNINVERCGFHLFGVGIQVGDLDPTGVTNNEYNTFRNLTLNYNDVGYRQYGNDSIANNFYNLWGSFNKTMMSFGTTDVTVGPTQSAHIFNLGASHNDTDIYFNNVVTGFYIYGGRSEHAGKFIDSRAAYNGNPNIALNNMTVIPIDGYAQTPFIKLYMGGLTAVNSTFGAQGYAEVTWQFPDTSNTTATFIGCDFLGDYVLDWQDNTTTFPQNTRLSMYGTRFYSGSAWNILSDRTLWTSLATAGYPNGYVVTDNSLTTLNVRGSDILVLGGESMEIAGLDNGYLGQRVTIVCALNATFTHGTTFRLDNAVDFTCNAPGALTMLKYTDYWVEIGRSTASH